jgi:hypothetical protein
MFFPRHISIAQQMKKCAKISNISLLNLHKHISKMHHLAQKIWERLA